MSMQEGQTAPEPSRPAEGQGSSQPMWWNQVPILLFGGMLILMLFRQGRKEKQEKQKLLESLQKNDRVLTVGGIYGTIVAIHENGDELTLKIDENVKIRITRTAVIRKVIPVDSAKTGEA